MKGYKLSMCSYKSSQSWDSCWGELVETCQQLEKPTKGSKGKKAFFCSFSDGGYPVITSPGALVRVP